MSIKADFSGLWAAVRQMGEYSSDFKVGDAISERLEIDDALSSTQGLDIELSDIDIHNGVLSYADRQVILFIPDHGSRLDDKLSGRWDGNKFHVADCRTLNEMRQKKRFARYKATYNTSGQFEIYGTSYSTGEDLNVEAELFVCKNCLNYLNYQGYKSGGKKGPIYQKFDIAEFLSQFSTLFKSMPSRHEMIDEAGYSDDWKAVSDNYRAAVAYTCEMCHVDLSGNRNLLHTHHINGNKRQNNESNLMALCIDCHRKQPHHDYMRVTHANMQLITALRREQDLLQSNSNWQSAREMADKSLDGLLRHYEKIGTAVPEIGYELEGRNNTVVAELEVAWPQNQQGIAIGNHDLETAQALGWHVISIGEALKEIN